MSYVILQRVENAAFSQHCVNLPLGSEEHFVREDGVKMPAAVKKKLWDLLMHYNGLQFRQC